MGNILLFCFFTCGYVCGSRDVYRYLCSRHISSLSETVVHQLFFSIQLWETVTWQDSLALSLSTHE